jgi:hypothetical protein
MQRFSKMTANTWADGQHPKGALDPRNDSGWSPDLTFDGPVRFTAWLDKPIVAREVPYLTVQVNFGRGQQYVPEFIELQVLTGNDDDTDLPPDIVAAVNKPPSARSQDQQQRLWQYCSETCVELARTRVELDNLKERMAVLTKSFTTMVMDVAAKPRETFILNRGDYSQPTEKVTAGTLKVLPALQKDAPENRLGLAQWVVDRSHPLTARVAVNRLWQSLFGVGIVATSADFGSQGEWPSHPALLDWLAVDFVDSGWDVKRLVKQMVMSATYQQRSATSATLIERDPQNRLLARGPRFRLSAEMIRDSALKISGLLVPRIGGPSVNPYMPGDLWREVSHYGSSPATAQTFVQDHGEKLYRRSLYTYWKRTAPPPNMMAFDAPNREICTIARGNTTTPLQALVTLNDVQFVEAARVFGEKILQRPEASDEGRLSWAFLETTSRSITDKELKVLVQALARERARYQNNPQAARTYVAAGEAPLPEDIALEELAAWAQIAAMLLNLSESVTRS